MLALVIAIDVAVSLLLTGKEVAAVLMPMRMDRRGWNMWSMLPSSRDDVASDASRVATHHASDRSCGMRRMRMNAKTYDGRKRSLATIDAGLRNGIEFGRGVRLQ